MATREEMLSALKNASDVADDHTAKPDSRATAAKDAQKIADMINARFPQKEILPAGSPAPRPNMNVTDVDFLQEDPGFIETELGQATGGMAGGLKAGLEAASRTKGLPLHVRGPIVLGASAAGAFGGGASGEVVQQGFQFAVDSPLAPDNLDETIQRAVDAGGEEAAYDALGNLLFKGGSAVYRGGIKPLVNESAPLIKQILEKGGSHASLGQLTDNALFKGLEGLTRNALIGKGSFDKLDLAQDQSLINFSKDYAEEYANAAMHELEPSATGKFFVETIQKGKSAFSDAASVKYGELDKVVQNVPLARLDVEKVPTNKLAQGKRSKGKGTADLGGFTRRTVETSDEFIPVDVSSVRGSVRDALNSLKRIGGVGETEEGGRLLKQLDALGGDVERLSFQDAHNLRSNLLSLKNNIAFKNQDSVANKNISTALGQIDGAMDDAGRLLDPEGLKAYRNVQRFYRFGKENFDNDMIKSLMKNEDAPSKIGMTLSSQNNPDLVKKARKAIKAAGMFADDVNFSDSWKKIQGGYLENLLPTNLGEVSNAPFLRLHKNKKMIQTLRATFTKEQQKSILDLSKAMDEIVESRGILGSLSSRQFVGGGQVVAGIVASGGASLGLGPAALLIGGPAIFAEIATRPALTKMFTTWSKSKPGTKQYALAAVKFARATGMSIDDLLTKDEQKVGGVVPNGYDDTFDGLEEVDDTLEGLQ